MLEKERREGKREKGGGREGVPAPNATEGREGVSAPNAREGREGLCM